MNSDSISESPSFQRGLGGVVRSEGAFIFFSVDLLYGSRGSDRCFCMDGGALGLRWDLNVGFRLCRLGACFASCFKELPWLASTDC